MSRMAALSSETAPRRKASAISPQVSGHECNRRDGRVNLYAVSPIVPEDSSLGDRCGEPASFPTGVKVIMTSFAKTGFGCADAQPFLAHRSRLRQHAVLVTTRFYLLEVYSPAVYYPSI